MKIGCVIPAVKDRIDNLNLVLKSLEESIVKPDQIVIICDGWFDPDSVQIQNHDTLIVGINKHEPGLDQPRNVGVKWLSADMDYVWFLDSDCIVGKDTLLRYKEAIELSNEPRVLLGPYEWLPEGRKTSQIGLRNDPRWSMFRKHEAHEVFVGDLGVALGNLSGNLVWPIDKFKEVGGFWNELYTGRCEDGELGLRAAALAVPMSLVKEARAWHIYHKANENLKKKRNQRDVPLINERHPWVQELGIVVVEKDGKRFDQICEGCGESINTIEYWEHSELCHA